MRLWPVRFLPIAVLALTLQALAPFAAVAQLAAAPFDPLTHGALCSDLAQAAPDDNRSSDRAPHHNSCCVLCAPLGPGAAALEGPASVAAEEPQRFFRHIVWSATELKLPVRPLDLNACPRAPPATL